MVRSADDPSPLPRPEPVAVAQRIADAELFPDALLIDRAAVVPARYLDLLAGAGLYGLFGPSAAGGLDADEATGARVIEALGGGSLAAAFVWIQHHGAVRALTAARPDLRERWLEPLCRGRIRAGVAVGALRRDGPPAVTAEPAGNGWILDGTAPWVTGWERINVVYLGARHGSRIVWVLLGADRASSLQVRAAELAACNSTSTVELELDRHPVNDGRVVDIEDYAAWQVRDRLGLRTNGYLSIGVAARCATLLDSATLHADVDAARDRLDRAEGPDVVAARADASLLAVRAASAVVVSAGGRGVDLRSHGQRLAREAMFLLVFGQTSDIRAAQRSRLLG